MEQKILEIPRVTVTYLAERQIGKIVWHGNPVGDDYRKPFLALIALAQKGHPVTRFLSDVRKQGVVSPENRKWFEAEMVPAAVANGLQRAAVLSDSNAFKRYYLNLILSTVNKFNMPFKIFNDEARAMEFLMEGAAEAQPHT